MTYNVFSGTLNPTHFTSLRLWKNLNRNLLLKCWWKNLNKWSAFGKKFNGKNKVAPFFQTQCRMMMMMMMMMMINNLHSTITCQHHYKGTPQRPLLVSCCFVELSVRLVSDTFIWRKSCTLCYVMSYPHCVYRSLSLCIVPLFSCLIAIEVTNRHSFDCDY